jgi:hypothetical protein
MIAERAESGVLMDQRGAKVPTACRGLRGGRSTDVDGGALSDPTPPFGAEAHTLGGLPVDRHDAAEID